MKKVIGKLKIIINVGDAKPGAPLTPLLGPHNIDVKKFIEQFNQKTSQMSNGVDVVACITKHSKISFEVFIKSTPISRLIFSEVYENHTISIEQLYDIIRFKKLFEKHYNKKNIDDQKFTLYAYNIIGILRSLHNIKINKDFYLRYDL